MPTYDYECLECGGRFERFESMSVKPAGKCPECGGDARRLIGAGAGVIFKGSGFYATDYKKPNLPQAREKRSTELKKPDKKPTLPAKVDSKPSKVTDKKPDDKKKK